MSNLPYPEQGRNTGLSMPEPHFQPIQAFYPPNTAYQASCPPNQVYFDPNQAPYPPNQASNNANQAYIPQGQVPSHHAQYQVHYPANQGPYPPSQAQHPASQAPPYPPGQGPYPPNLRYNSSAYPPHQGAPGSPYPPPQAPESTYPPLAPPSAPSAPSMQSYPSPNQSYPPSNQPYPPSNQPYSSSNQSYPPSHQPYPSQPCPYPAAGQPSSESFDESNTTYEEKGGLVSEMANLAVRSAKSGQFDPKKLGSEIKKQVKDHVKKMFNERSAPAPRPSHHFRYAPEAPAESPPEVPSNLMRDAKTFKLDVKEMEVRKFYQQDYSKLKKELLRSGKRFEDPRFDPRRIELTEGAEGNLSIYGFRGNRYRGNEIEWRRPGEISSDPKMFVNDNSRFDINQGEIGDCWFLAALANLAENKECFDRVVPSRQSFDSREYTGMFRFRFYRFGEWVEVVVDDRLPTRNGKLIYLKSRDSNEFWSALLEKAYAKLYGSYKVLEGGITIEAAVDFTGGIPEMIDLNSIGRDEQKSLFDYMKNADDKNAFMSCSLSNSSYQNEAQRKGLQARHAYTITKVVEIRGRGIRGSIPLIRLRNPHGNNKEWTGDWSDRDPHWKNVPSRIRNDLDLRLDDDGEFYMSFNRDFIKYFGDVEMVHLTPGTIRDIASGEDDDRRKYNMIHFKGEWSRSLGTAGGCGNDSVASFAQNPQFFFSIREPSGLRSFEKKCPVVVSLAQRVLERKSEYAIGFKIYKAEPGVEKVDARFLSYNQHVAKTAQFINLREISLRAELGEGDYLVIPSTFHRGEEGQFLLRLYFDKRWSGQGKDGGGPGVERGGGAPADNGGRTPRPAAGAGALPGRGEGGFVGRGFGGYASRVINIPIHILNEGNTSEKKGKRRNKLDKFITGVAETLDAVYQWSSDRDSEISLFNKIIDSINKAKDHK